MKENQLNLEHIQSLIGDVTYQSIGCAMTCYITVGDATIVGNSYCFDMDLKNNERARESAYNDAVKQLWHLEAYHLKRLRGK